ncbi:DUF3574 domain-containing protein [Streptomyces sp. NA04227]|nr:DUF3574 domain-containing protein [Streptomyces sp. NA04227]QKW11306.1 DUF3574 domain-containing protein [Streptomyces sp. NA04227]
MSPVQAAHADVAVAASADGSPSVRAQKSAYVETRLFFGTVRPNGGPSVTRDEFQSFVDESVTPRFPEGLTVQEGHGQYRDGHGIVEREDSYELILFYPVAQRASADMNIEAIRAEYTKRFDQESVARIDHEVTVDF